MKQRGLEVIGSLKEVVERYEKMEEFLKQLYGCGSAYSPDPEQLMAFLQRGEAPYRCFKPAYPGQKPNPGWWELRDIVRPDFDDSE